MRTVVIIGLLLLASCQVSRQRSTSVKAREQFDLNESIKTFQQSDEREIDFGRETVIRSGSGTFLEIVPRGSFRVLSDGTFEGDAEAVRTYRWDTVEGRVHENTHMRESFSAEGLSEERGLISSKELEVEEEKETWRRPGWMGIVILGAVAVLVFAVKSLYKWFNLWP